MKLIGFWLLVLIAVLVPATASIATSLVCPTMSVAKAQPRGPSSHMAATRHAAASLPQAKAQSTGKQAAAGQATDHCCDYTPCSQCTGCGSCASMAATAPAGADMHPLDVALLPEGGGPRAEFLLSGQERPPRTS